MKCSIFTNGSQIDEVILDYVRDGILYPIIKIDTFSLEQSTALYGTKDAQKNLDAIERLFEVACNMDVGYCPVGASIVPTAKNLNEMVSIVQRCFENNVFPLLGQLEYAGNAISEYDALLLTREELLKLKADISEAIGEEYKVPICPSVIAGIHITNDGFVSADKKSGLSCSWFWLETPQTIQLCGINVIESFEEADRAVMRFRTSVIEQMAVLTEQIEEHPFGGCGGNVRDLARAYVELHSSMSEH